MPTPHLPAKPRAKAGVEQHSVDWLGLWALSLGVCAVALAAIVYFAAGDALGAAMTLAATAAIIATMLHVCRRPSPDR